HAAVLDRFVAALGLSDITLVVNDWGGPIGLAVAGHRPELFSRLVIGNSWAWPVEGDPHFARFSAFVGRPAGRVLVTRVDPCRDVGALTGRGQLRRGGRGREAHHRSARVAPAHRHLLTIPDLSLRCRGSYQSEVPAGGHGGGSRGEPGWDSVIENMEPASTRAA